MTRIDSLGQVFDGTTTIEDVLDAHILWFGSIIMRTCGSTGRYWLPTTCRYIRRGYFLRLLKELAFRPGDLVDGFAVAAPYPAVPVDDAGFRVGLAIVVDCTIAGRAVHVDPDEAAAPVVVGAVAVDMELAARSTVTGTVAGTLPMSAADLEVDVPEMMLTWSGAVGEDVAARHG